MYDICTILDNRIKKTYLKYWHNSQAVENHNRTQEGQTMKDLIARHNICYDYYRIVIIWGMSASKDTYGQNRVTLKVDSDSFSAVGGGYDLMGAVLSQWVERDFQDDLAELKRSNTIEVYNSTTDGGVEIVKIARTFSDLFAITQIFKKMGYILKSFWVNTTIRAFFLTPDYMA